jgi:callose synthase
MCSFCLTSALLTKAYQTAAVLFEVLKAVNVSQSVEVDQAVSNNRFISVVLAFFAFLVHRGAFNFSSAMPSFLTAQILDTHHKIEEKKKLYVPYNILPLDPESTDQAIMQYPEVFFSILRLVPNTALNLIFLSLSCSIIL